MQSLSGLCFRRKLTIDSLNDIDGLNYVWDTDITVDSNGDGIKDNDADLVGARVEHVFKQEGRVTIKAIVWDENPEKPGVKELVVNVGPADRTLIEDAGALLAGEDANPIAQLALALIVILLLVLVARRLAVTMPRSRIGKRMNLMLLLTEMVKWIPWHANLQHHHPDLFLNKHCNSPAKSTASEDISIDELLAAPELPETGLPDGWTMEQWNYYGHEWLKVSKIV